ncbi:hypothetical protein GJ699_04870 [Duganella sp. FT80W]|uniref:Uncharacterized protein n=1 Tax=Duganella guangzhouensis TaxID=2666084 RepID=A0A6I2KZ61_9BURK|nr:hypothetical protein [Duganella guangzhouensis]MRW89309.1 hypothetical protein [Duganella guangzhouensis]
MKFVKPAALAVALAYGTVDDDAAIFQPAPTGADAHDAIDFSGVIDVAVANLPYGAVWPQKTQPRRHCCGRG